MVGYKAVDAVRERLETLVPRSAQLDIGRNVRAEDQVILRITPVHQPKAADIWIYVPGDERHMIFGAGEDFRVEDCTVEDALTLIEGIVMGGFVEQVYRWRDRVVGTRGCVKVDRQAKPICESGNMGRLPAMILGRFGVHQTVVRYPSY